MKLGRVVGTVVSTINSPAFDDRTLLVCDVLGPDLEPAGGYLIAVDTVGAGAGEVVLLLDEGNSARQILRSPAAPIRTVVVGIVDDVTLRTARTPSADVPSAEPAGPARRPRAAARPVRS